MSEVEYTTKAKKALAKLNELDRKLVADKITYCLGKHLFDYILQCNRKELKGAKISIYRMHIQRKYTVFYTIEGMLPNRHAKIKEIIGFEAAHQKYGRL